MKKLFHPYLRPSEEEFGAMWTTALFSFDASALLNVYGYSQETSRALTEFITAQADRIRLPYQCALEYVRNRPKAIVKQLKHYEATLDDLSRVERSRIQPRLEHPHLSPAAIAAFETIKEELDAGLKRMEELLSADPFAEAIFAALEGKVGPEPQHSELSKLHSEADRRFQMQIPPGFADAKAKGKPGVYGDYIVWAQLMELASREKRDILFVTDDGKDDWWWREGSRTIGPRPELLLEFSSDSGQRIWFYRSDSFLHAAKQYGLASMADTVVNEVASRLEEHAREEEAKRAKPSYETLEVGAVAKPQPETPAVSHEDKPVIDHSHEKESRAAEQEGAMEEGGKMQASPISSGEKATIEAMGEEG